MADDTIEKARNQFFAFSLAELIYHQKAISFLCAPPAAVEWIWAARKRSLPRITGARTATKSSRALATSCPARAANRRIPKLPGNQMSEHLLEMAKARVRVKDGKIEVLTDPGINCCPLRRDLYGIKEESRETVERVLQSHMQELGMYGPKRVLELQEKPVSFGASEILMDANARMVEREVELKMSAAI
jgi:hypothetical protein